MGETVTDWKRLAEGTAKYHVKLLEQRAKVSGSITNVHIRSVL